MDRLFTDRNIASLPPIHVVRFLQEIITHPTRDRHVWGILLNKIFLPTDLHQHASHLICDFVIARLLISCSVAIHFVDADGNLLHAKQVDQSGMLPSLTLDFSSFVISLSDGSGEVT